MEQSECSFPNSIAKLDEIIEAHQARPEELVAILREANGLFGTLSEEMQLRIAERLGIPPSEIFAFVSFAELELPKGEHKVSVCKGTSCFLKGANNLLERITKELGVQPGDTTDDGKFSVELARCLGACALGPVIMVDESVHPRLEPDKVPQIIKEYK